MPRRSRRESQKPVYLRSAEPRYRRSAARRGRRTGRPSGAGGARYPRAAHSRTFTPRRNPLVPVLAALTLLALIAGAAAVWLFSQPIHVVIASSPEDAIISACGTRTAGFLQAADLAPGLYPVTITRTGFATLTAEVEVRRFAENRFDYSLEPVPQAISVSAKPEQATCRILQGEVEVVAGTGSVEGEVQTGEITVEIALDGYNTLTRTLYLDRPAQLSFILDPAGQLVHTLGMLECAGAPKGVVITPDGSEAWATILNGPPSIEIFDLAEMRKTGEIDLGKYGAVEIVFNAEGTRAYASQMETAKVFEIDTAKREVLREFDTESAWTKVVLLSQDGSTLFAANWSGDDVSVIELATGKLERRVPGPNTPRGLWATGPQSLFVAGFDDGDLWRVDPTTGDGEEVFAGDGALRHIVGDAKRNVLFVSDMARDRVYLHDVASGKTRTFVDTDEKPNTIDLSPDGKVLFVSCRGENNPKSYYIPGPEWGTILLFDAESGEPLDAIVGGNQCTALDVSDDGRLLVFSDFLDDRLRVYEVPPYEELAAGGGGRWKQHFEELKK